MAGIPKHKPEAWKEHKLKELEKKKALKESIKKKEKELLTKKSKETGIIHPKVIGDPKSKMPQIGSKDHPWDSKTGTVLAPDGLPKGESILKEGKAIPNIEVHDGGEIIIGKNVDKDLL